MENINEMRNTIFAKLIKKLKLETGEDLETVGLTANHNNYELSFNGDMLDDYDLNVTLFGRMHQGKWEDMKPTPAQLKGMQDLLNVAVMEIETEKERDRINMEMEEQEYYRNGEAGSLYSKFY